MAALSAAWRLSGDENVGAITVYQRGWRLGGKGASSRGEHGRIEEHGLHVWLGYYDNSFRVMRECYAELDRETTSPQCPIRSWRDAFAPSSAVGLATRSSGRWEDWTALFSPNDQLPGEPEITNRAMSPAMFMLRSQALVRDFLSSLGDLEEPTGRITLSADPTPPSAPGGIVAFAQRAIDAAAAVALELTHISMAGLEQLPSDNAAADAATALLGSLGDRIRHLVLRHTGSRRMFELLDVVVTSMRGIITDGLLIDPRGFSAINGEEYRDWLRRHGAATETFDSPLVLGLYDLVFGYRDGDPELPRFAAGTGLQLSASCFFEYKGSIFWKMQAGMGDVVFAPLYEALRARGVRFEFFHDVRELTVSPDGLAVDGVRLARQVELADGLAEYSPLEDFGGLACFPATPALEQLRCEVSEPKRLETLWCRDVCAEMIELRQGVDYDDLVLGVSIGMVPFVCAEILERDPAWRQMARHVATVATQSLQVWFRDTETELGWRHPGSTITGYVKPFDTAASMSHLLGVEQWPDHASPRSVFYFCSTLPEGDPPGPEARDYAERQLARVRANAVQFLEAEVGQLLPGSKDPEGFDWNGLVGDGDLTGTDRIDSQFLSANVDPSDRYVQSLPGTDRFRLRPDASGYKHLFLAGDWTDCGLNAGCIEAAVISGLQAANAITDRDRWAGISGAWTPRGAP